MNISKLVEDYKEFPYKKIVAIDRKAEYLRKYEPSLVIGIGYNIPNVVRKNFPKINFVYEINGNRRPVLFVCDEEEYWKGNILIDYFQEKVRMFSKKINEKDSPVNMWKDPKVRRKVIEGVIRSKKEVNNFTVREEIYKQIKECTSFKITIAVSLYKMFKAKSILDTCAGWGDRLLAAAVLGLEYDGTDPNPDVHHGYNEIIKTFGDKDKQKVYLSGFENFCTKKESFDLVISSPPYYDLEEYRSREVGIKGQSIAEQPTLREWLDNFLFPLVVKAWSFVKPGGHYILYMNDYATAKGQVSYVHETINYILTHLKNCHFKGVISQTNSIENAKIKAQPFWIFTKSEMPERDIQ